MSKRRIGIDDLSKTWKAPFHKCKICGVIFHHDNKRCYCSKCIPKFNGWSSGYSVALNYGFALAERREHEKQQLRKEANG